MQLDGIMFKNEQNLQSSEFFLASFISMLLWIFLLNDEESFEARDF